LYKDEKKSPQNPPIYPNPMTNVVEEVNENEEVLDGVLICTKTRRTMPQLFCCGCRVITIFLSPVLAHVHPPIRQSLLSASTRLFGCAATYHRARANFGLQRWVEMFELKHDWGSKTIMPKGQAA
jgi:hypothetical protein